MNWNIVSEVGFPKPQKYEDSDNVITYDNYDYYVILVRNEQLELNMIAECFCQFSLKSDIRQIFADCQELNRKYDEGSIPKDMQEHYSNLVAGIPQDYKTNLSCWEFNKFVKNEGTSWHSQKSFDFLKEDVYAWFKIEWPEIPEKDKMKTCVIVRLDQRPDDILEQFNYLGSLEEDIVYKEIIQEIKELGLSEKDYVVHKTYDEYENILTEKK